MDLSNIRVPDNEYPSGFDASYQANNGSPVRVSDIFWILRRSWLLPLIGCLVGLAAGITYVVIAPEIYKSSARILLDRSVNRYLQTNKIIDEPTLDDMDLGGQIYVLSSDSIIVPVVRSLDLAHDPEFVGPPRSEISPDSPSLSSCLVNADIGCAAESIGASFRKLKESIKQSLGLKSGTSIDLDTALERTAVEKLLTRLTVERADVPNVINVTYASPDPMKAAKIANAIADTYIANIERRKINSGKMVSQLLESRLTDLKQQSLKADRELQEFKKTNNLFNAVPDNQLIMRLRSQYVDVATKARELEHTLGPAHLAVIKLRKQMDDLDNAIRNEELRIAAAPEENSVSDSAAVDAIDTEQAGDLSDLSVAESTTNRNDELSARVSKLDGQLQIKYRELETTARALRALYNSALRKFNEMNQSRLENEDAHIITRAAPPLHKSSKSLLVLGAGIVFGLFAGMGTAVAREWTAGVFRRPDQVKRATGLYCVVLETIRKQKSASIADYVVEAPYSRFTEQFRHVRALIKATRRNKKGGLTICVVSSVSQEGKTTVANNLADLMSMSATSRLLIIDCDLRRRMVTRELVPDANEGLIEALADPSRLSSLVVRRERSKVDVLPCVLSEPIVNASELLGSSQMEKLLEVAREAYDFIVIEAPPIMSVVDVKIIERFIDQFVFVIEWGETKQRLVEEALSEVEGIRDRIVCAILNKADPATLRSIEAYKGRRVGAYYLG
ncbi:AAA family ATPase [Hyphomicrobium sp. ghe19]|uniref:GumC family protein n=1 Tax=Hyphomicrobium sp. ghe19 TaxID=2682968 RepID=UPI0013668266|nr:Tyrosine-protein kinase ptk [Hyphomicrobium sp. ghe19]